MFRVFGIVLEDLPTKVYCSGPFVQVAGSGFRNGGVHSTCNRMA